MRKSEREGEGGKDRLIGLYIKMASSSLFSSHQSFTTPKFKIIRSVHKHLQVAAEEKGTTELKNNLASKFVASSEAAARRIRGNRSRGKPQRGLNDPRAKRTIFIGNIPSKCSRKDIKNLLKGHGSIETIRLRSVKVTSGDRPTMVAKRTHKQLQEDSTFNAYVVFSSETEAKECLCLNGTLIHGRHLRVDKVDKGKNPQDNQRSVFVGNIPFTADEEKLREVFSPCGNIEAVRIIRDSKSGLGKGFGYIMFADKAGVMFSIRQNQKLKIDGRVLRVSRCKGQPVIPKPRKADTLSRKKGGVERLVATKYVGKLRPDGTKNRLYRLPATSS